MLILSRNFFINPESKIDTSKILGKGAKEIAKNNNNYQ